MVQELCKSNAYMIPDQYTTSPMASSRIPTQFGCWTQVLCTVRWIYTATALVRPQQILVNHHFTTSTLYLNTSLISEGKSVPRVLQNTHVWESRKLVQKTFSTSCNTQNPLQLQKPSKDPKGPRELLHHEQSRDFQFLRQQWLSKAKAQGGWGCPASPTPSPMGLPPNPEPTPTYLGGVRAACSPSSRSGDGVPGGNS